MYHVLSTLQSIYSCSDERTENEDLEEGNENSGRREREWRLLDLLYADNLVLCSGSEDLKVMMERFI